MLPGGDIHLRNLKDIKIFPKVLYKWVSDSLKSDLFSDPLKPAKITCTYKRKYLFVKDSCWPIGNISLIPNVFEKFIYSQVYGYMHTAVLKDSNRLIVLGMNFAKLIGRAKGT